jgi:hypothetical protein
MSALTPTTTLAELAAHQQARKTYAFSLGEDARRLARLQAVHAKKVAELNAYTDLLEEATPDFILRTADGREIALRLPSDDARSLCCTMREVLENEIRLVEEKIIDYLLIEQEENDIRSRKPSGIDLRPAILALCQPVPPQAAAKPTEHPTMEVAGPPAGSLPTAA